MELTVKDAAALLGKSPRTIRHLAQSGKLPAKRKGGRWVIDRDALDSRVEIQAEARGEQLELVRGRLNSALDAAKPPSPDGTKRDFYSVRDMKTYAVAIAQLTEIVHVRETHAEIAPALECAETALRDCLRMISEGCHPFQPQTKIDRYVRARGHACVAIADLLAFNAVRQQPELTPLVDRIERDLLRSLRGLIRRAEKIRR